MVLHTETYKGLDISIERSGGGLVGFYADGAYSTENAGRFETAEDVASYCRHSIDALDDFVEGGDDPGIKPQCKECGNQSFNINLTDCFDMTDNTIGEADDADSEVFCADCGRPMGEVSRVIITAYWRAKKAK